MNTVYTLTKRARPLQTSTMRTTYTSPNGDGVSKRVGVAVIMAAGLLSYTLVGLLALMLVAFD